MSYYDFASKSPDENWDFIDRCARRGIYRIQRPSNQTVRPWLRDPESLQAETLHAIRAAGPKRTWRLNDHF